MTASSRLSTLLLVLLAAGCASAPAPAPRLAAPAPQFASPGLVIGTVSYQYLAAGERTPGATWVVRFERLDQPDADFALAVEVDPARQSGVFTGALPAGVYAFREASAAERRFAAGTLKMPFELQPGEVKDAGHYALQPAGDL